MIIRSSTSKSVQLVSLRRGVDVGLVSFIVQRGGRVTVRQIVRSLASCATAAVTETKLQAIADAGYGGWVSQPMTERGGRPSRVFALNDAGMALGPVLRPPRLKVRRPAGKASLQQIARDVIHHLNRYSRTPCDDLVQALTEASRVLASIGKNEDKDLLSLCPRTIKVSRRGHESTTWKSE